MAITIRQAFEQSPVIPHRAFFRARAGIEEGQKTHQVDQPAAPSSHSPS